jgi:hypothetical protein
MSDTQGTPVQPPPDPRALKVSEVQRILGLTRSLPDSTERLRLQVAAVDLKELCQEAERLGVDTRGARPQLLGLPHLAEKEVRPRRKAIVSAAKTLREELLQAHRGRGEALDGLKVQLQQVEQELQRALQPAGLFERSPLRTTRDEVRRGLRELRSTLTGDGADPKTGAEQLEELRKTALKLGADWSHQLLGDLHRVAGDPPRDLADQHQRLIETVEQDDRLSPDERDRLVDGADAALARLLSQDADPKQVAVDLDALEREHGDLSRSSRRDEAREALRALGEALDQLTPPGQGRLPLAFDPFRLLRVEAGWLLDARRYPEAFARLDGQLDALQRLIQRETDARSAWELRQPEVLSARQEARRQLEAFADLPAFHAEADAVDTALEPLRRSPPPGGWEAGAQALTACVRRLEANVTAADRWSRDEMATHRDRCAQQVARAAEAATTAIDELREDLLAHFGGDGAPVEPPPGWAPAAPRALEARRDELLRAWAQQVNEAVDPDGLTPQATVLCLQAVADEAAQREPARRGEAARIHAAVGQAHVDELHTLVTELHRFEVRDEPREQTFGELSRALDGAVARGDAEAAGTVTGQLGQLVQALRQARDDAEQAFKDWVHHIRVLLQGFDNDLQKLDKQRKKEHRVGAGGTFRSALDDLRATALEARAPALRSYVEGRLGRLGTLLGAELGQKTPGSEALLSLIGRLRRLKDRLQTELTQHLTTEVAELTTAADTLRVRVQGEGSTRDTEHAAVQLEHRFNALLFRHTNLVLAVEEHKRLHSEVKGLLEGLQKDLRFATHHPSLWADLHDRLAAAKDKVGGDPEAALEKVSALLADLKQIGREARATGTDQASGLLALQERERKAREATEAREQRRAELTRRWERLRERHGEQDLPPDPEVARLLKLSEKALPTEELDGVATQLDLIEERLNLRDGIGADPKVQVQALPEVVVAWRKAAVAYEEQLRAIAHALRTAPTLVDAKLADPLAQVVNDLSGRFDPAGFDVPVRTILQPDLDPALRRAAREQALARVVRARDLLRADRRLRDLAHCPLPTPAFTAPALLHRCLLRLERVLLMAVA